jgi:hypothetical protein
VSFVWVAASARIRESSDVACYAGGPADPTSPGTDDPTTRVRIRSKRKAAEPNSLTCVGRTVKERANFRARCASSRVRAAMINAFGGVFLLLRAGSDPTSGQSARLSALLIEQTPDIFYLAKTCQHFLVRLINGSSFRYSAYVDHISVRALMYDEWIRCH